MRIAVDGYVARIANATPLQLVIINYEVILDYLNAAEKSIKEKNKNDIKFNLNKARQFLKELRLSLDMSYSLAKYLMNLYIYVDQQICYCLVNEKQQHIQECRNVLEKLLISWKTIENEEEDKTPLMENTQQLYAGLTYGKNGLEEYVDNSKRGFKA